MSPTTPLAARLAQYAYTPPRRSPRGTGNAPTPTQPASARKRKRAPEDEDEGDGDGDASDAAAGGDGTDSVKLEPGDSSQVLTPLRRASAKAAASPSPSPSTRRGDGSLLRFGWKKPRQYAPPEMYAHLSHITDCIEPGLDLIFCGINPGQRSARDGHHFAHPTNKFWRALYHSGLTPRLLHPSEDATLPGTYRYGLTNLVPRPTAEAAQLSRLEMRLQVAPLLEKILAHRPRVVCFVGKKIYDVFATVIRQAQRGTMPSVKRELGVDVVGDEEGEGEEGDEDEGGLDASAASASTSASASVAVSANATPRRQPQVKTEPESPSALRVVQFGLDEDRLVELDETLVKLEPGASPSPARRANATPKGKGKAKGKAKATTKAPPFEWDGPQPLRLPLPVVSEPPLHQPSPRTSDGPGSCGTNAEASVKAEHGGRETPRRRTRQQQQQEAAEAAPADAPDTTPPPSSDSSLSPAPPSPAQPLHPGPASAPWNYTYFWAVPSTSGLSRAPIPEQIALFARCREFVESLRAGQVPPGEFVDIDMEVVAGAVAEMRAVAEEKGLV